MLDGLQPVIVNVRDGAFSVNNLWVHDESEKTKANLLSRFFDLPGFPRPFGVLYALERASYEEEVSGQIGKASHLKGRIPLNKILSGEKTWTL